MKDYSTHLARRTHTMSSSAIREIFKVLATPGMLSLAGGIPAPESFPMDIINHLHEVVVEKYGSSIFQYGITEGFPPLREVLVNLVARKSIKVTSDNICVSTGAQSAIDAAAKVLIDREDIVAIEAPTFLASIKTFKAYEPNFVELPTDDEGIIPDAYEDLLKTKKVKLTYIIPTFQNPTGRSLSLERRKAIAQLAKEYDSLILEDDPYYELRYEGTPHPPIYTFAPEHVIYVGSLSKIFSPGLRLGYYIAPKAISDLMTSVRQGVEVHPNHYGQALASEYLGKHFDTHLPKILDIYRPRLSAMLNALEAALPEGFYYSKPEGGMFVWVEGIKGFNASKAYEEGIRQKVAFVPGKYFFVDPSKGEHTLRLNFTTESEDTLKRGIKLLGAIFSKV